MCRLMINEWIRHELLSDTYKVAHLISLVICLAFFSTVTPCWATFPERNLFGMNWNRLLKYRSPNRQCRSLNDLIWLIHDISRYGACSFRLSEPTVTNDLPLVAWKTMTWVQCSSTLVTWLSELAYSEMHFSEPHWRGITVTITVLQPLYRTTCVSPQRQLRTGGFCWS